MEAIAIKKVLLTGSTGFIGSNLLPLLSEHYDIIAPKRSELDLYDSGAVRNYLCKGSFDAVVHFANPTAHNPIDAKRGLLEGSLRVFSSFEHCSDFFGKLIYLGSGAEYGKHRDITLIKEESFGDELPKDTYGLSRYIIYRLAEKYENIINLRLFGCYGPGDFSHKLIPHVIESIESRKTIELKQDVWFDYLYVNDILPTLLHFIENPAKYTSYNLCSSQPVLISSVAQEVQKQMGSYSTIIFQKDGLNLEYTGSNERLCAELPSWKPRPISEGVREILRKMP